MGTPHLRCREMHQSERPSVMAVIRFSPDAGTQSTPRIASSAAARKPSTEANHCSGKGRAGGWAGSAVWLRCASLLPGRGGCPAEPA
jgi:hypothetical protein